MPSRYIKTSVAFVKATIAKKSTLHGAKLKLPLIIRTKIRPNGTPKSAKKRIIRWSH
jgi:hypothetical protein